MERQLNSQRNTESGVDFLHFGIRKMSGVVCKYAFRKTDQIITKNGTVVLEPFVDANFNLGRKTTVVGINRSTNDARETLVDTFLTGNNKKNPLVFRVVF